MTDRRPVLAVTLGDPAGVGPEIVLKSLNSRKVYQACRPVVIGDASVLASQAVRSSLKVHPILNPARAEYRFGVLDVLHIPCGNYSKVKIGMPNRLSGENSFLSVQKSLELAMAKLVHGVVHAPISKLAWKMAGADFPGQTELAAQMCGMKSFAMAIAAGSIRTVLVTRHVPLSQVSRYIRKEKIVTAGVLAYQWMKRLKISRPRIGICALNPHAGEEGLMGAEEMQVIGPAVKTARKKIPCDVDGPLPADSAFKDHKAGRYDCLITMYHDQSLIPVKFHDPERIVNITLGLPFPRTSPGHGTAFDIAGKNRATPLPMLEAILTCARLARNN